MALPSPSLLLLGLPPGTSATLNLLSFTTTASFTGFKSLPPGAHLFSTSPSASGLAARHGIWLYIPPGEQTLLVYKYDASLETLLPIEGAELLSARANIAGAWGSMVDYSSAVRGDAWPGLASGVTPGYLSKLFTGPWNVDSFSESSATDAAGVKLAVLPSRRGFAPTLVGRERTLAATDGSAYLLSVLGVMDGEEGFLAEMQFCFLTALVVTNIVLLEHWRALISAVLGCRSLVAQNPVFFVRVLKELTQQLERVVLADTDDAPAQKQPPAKAEVDLEKASEQELLAYDLPLRGARKSKPLPKITGDAAEEEKPVPGMPELARLFLDADAGVTRPDGTSAGFLHPLVSTFRSGLDALPTTAVGEVKRALAELEGRLFEWFGWTFDDDSDDEDDAPAVVELTQEQLDALGYGGTVVERSTGAEREKREDVQAGLAALRDRGVSRVVVDGDTDSEDEKDAREEEEEEEWDTTNLEDLDERY